MGLVLFQIMFSEDNVPENILMQSIRLLNRMPAVRSVTKTDTDTGKDGKRGDNQLYAHMQLTTQASSSDAQNDVKTPPTGVIEVTTLL